MLKEIYQEIVKQDHDTVRREGLVDDLIDQLVRPYKGRISSQDMDTLKDLLSAVALAGEEAGFEIGAKFTISFLAELTTHRHHPGHPRLPHHPGRPGGPGRTDGGGGTVSDRAGQGVKEKGAARKQPPIIDNHLAGVAFSCVPFGPEGVWLLRNPPPQITTLFYP